MNKGKNDDQTMSYIDEPAEIFNRMYLNMLANEPEEGWVAMDSLVDEKEELNKEVLT